MKAGDGALQQLLRIEFRRVFEITTRPLWVVLSEDIAKEPFHLEKKGVSDAMESTQKPNRKLLN
jgi:hypothetical protein